MFTLALQVTLVDQARSGAAATNGFSTAHLTSRVAFDGGDADASPSDGETPCEVVGSAACAFVTPKLAILATARQFATKKRAPKKAAFFVQRTRHRLRRAWHSAR